MEKIEVELTPVRIVEKPTATGNAGGGVIPLRFQAVFKSTGVLENKDVIIPNPIVFEVPQEYVGSCAMTINSGGLTVLDSSISLYHSIEPTGLQDSDVTLNLDVFVLPVISAEPIATQEVDIEIIEKVVETEWLNVPAYKVIGSPNRYNLRDDSGGYMRFRDVSINIKTNGVDNYRSESTISYNYEKLYYLVRSADGTQQEVSTREIRDTVFNLPDIASVSVVYEDSQQNVRYEQELSRIMPM